MQAPPNNDKLMELHPISLLLKKQVYLLAELRINATLRPTTEAMAQKYRLENELEVLNILLKKVIHK